MGGGCKWLKGALVSPAHGTAHLLAGAGGSGGGSSALPVGVLPPSATSSYQRRTDRGSRGGMVTVVILGTYRTFLR